MMKFYVQVCLVVLMTLSMFNTATYTEQLQSTLAKSKSIPLKFRRSSELFNDFKSKRSPFLRIDELQNRIYSKNKIGGGVIDPLSLGKRGSSDGEVLASVIYSAFEICLKNEKCINTLRMLINDESDEKNDQTKLFWTLY